MAKAKIQNFIKTFLSRKILVISLIIVTGVLLFTIFFLKNSDTGLQQNGNNNTSDSNNQTLSADTSGLETRLSSGADSVLANFGIKPEWISTNFPPGRPGFDPKHPAKDVGWFSKSVIIPKDVNTIEINADLNSYISSHGLKCSVSENILTKDITILVNRPDSSERKIPLAKITVEHSDKISRESSVLCVIINGLSGYSQEEIEKLILNKQDFSYIFPRSLDEIETQNKLLNNKKDIIINVTAGAYDNYDADFQSTMNEKQVREKVKGFSTDFPTVNSVLLTKQDNDIPESAIKLIESEFSRFNIKVIRDNETTGLLTKAEEDSGDKLTIFFANLQSKAFILKSAVTVVNIDADEFDSFYNEVLRLKKTGLKFYNFSEYYSRKTEMEKKETEKQVKLKKEQDDKLAEKKKSEQKKILDKKKQDKKKSTEKNRKNVKPKKDDRKKK